MSKEVYKITNKEDFEENIREKEKLELFKNAYNAKIWLFPEIDMSNIPCIKNLRQKNFFIIQE